MLNYKGLYYAKDVLDSLNEIKNNLLDERIIKTTDIGKANQGNIIAILNSQKTDFLSNKAASVNITGFSELNIRSLKYMGSSNLLNKELGEVLKYYNDLKAIEDNHLIGM